MKFANIKKSAPSPLLLAFAVTASAGSACAIAAEPGWYLGGNIGLSQAEIDDKRIIEGLESEGFATTSFEDDDRDVGYKLFGGYQFNRYLAIEGGYFDLGRFDFETTTQPPGSLSGDIEIAGLNLDLVGTLPISRRVAAFVRGGASHAESKVRFEGDGAVDVTDPRRDKKATNYKFGLGLEFALTDAIGLRAEAERYRIDDAVGNDGDVDLYSVGLVYRFATAPAAPSVQVPASAPMVATRPAPVAPAPAPAPAVRRVTFSADSLFDFDASVVKAEGRRDLDAFVAELEGARYDAITVTGHTDRMGSDDYNIALSTRRAVAVKDYLVAAGIPASRIVTRGINGAEPVTRPEDCKATMPRTQRIACLQPDRRVEVEVSGTK